MLGKMPVRRRKAMNQIHNPPEVGSPAGHYSHAISAPAAARWLYISGQVGTAADGTVPADAGVQSEACWAKLQAILADAGMGLADLVKVTAFLTREGDIAGYRAVRDRVLGEHKPASTLVVVSRLARPEWLVEVEAVAAK
jgi:2-iminobutanoate/2-iminopropanoate deaminase